MAAPSPPAPPPQPPPPFSFGVPVPVVLWDCLEEALKANMRRLAKDIATTLAQPEQPLMEALFKGKGATVRPYLYEESEEKDVDLRCSFVCQRPDAPYVLQPCGRPAFWDAARGAGPHRCTRHLFTPSRLLPRLPKAFPFKDETGDEELSEQLYHSEAGEVYNAQHQLRGHFQADRKRLVLFELEGAVGE